AIYLKAVAALGVAPEEIFYVDDRPELIKQANELAIRGFVFKGAEQFKLDLASCGVNPVREPRSLTVYADGGIKPPAAFSNGGKPFKKLFKKLFFSTRENP
ncbi:MAG: hypothetical protein V1919_03955, partial [Candidatus Omnitrophota bacterium]